MALCLAGELAGDPAADLRGRTRRYEAADVHRDRQLRLAIRQQALHDLDRRVDDRSAAPVDAVPDVDARARQPLTRGDGTLLGRGPCHAPPPSPSFSPSRADRTTTAGRWHLHRTAR